MDVFSHSFHVNVGGFVCRKCDIYDLECLVGHQSNMVIYILDINLEVAAFSEPIHVCNGRKSSEVIQLQP